jgi:hypothetical protein
LADADYAIHQARTEQGLNKMQVTPLIQINTPRDFYRRRKHLF